MTSSYLPYAPQQQMLLPHALQEWLPEGHLAYYISDTVDSLDLNAFHARYAGGGSRNQPFHPSMMLKVLVYGYATGVFSSRKLARKLHEDIAFRVLAAGNYPAHRTICDFRAFHLKELSDLFIQVVKLTRECGLVKLGTIAVDGTKIKANASRHKAMSYERMQKTELELKAQIDALLAKAKAADHTERNEPDLDIPAEITRCEDRLAVIQAARARLEERQRHADTSSDAAPMTRIRRLAESPPQEVALQIQVRRTQTKDSREFHRRYNGQTAVDDTAHIIVAPELSNSGADSRQLPGALEAARHSTGAVRRRQSDLCITRWPYPRCLQSCSVAAAVPYPLSVDKN